MSFRHGGNEKSVPRHLIVQPGRRHNHRRKAAQNTCDHNRRNDDSAPCPEKCCASHRDHRPIRRHFVKRNQIPENAAHENINGGHGQNSQRQRARKRFLRITHFSCYFRRVPPSSKRKKSRHNRNSQRRSQRQSSLTLRGKWHKIRPGTEPKSDGPKYQSPEHEKFQPRYPAQKSSAHPHADHVHRTQRPNRRHSSEFYLHRRPVKNISGISCETRPKCCRQSRLHHKQAHPSKQECDPRSVTFPQENVRSACSRKPPDEFAVAQRSAERHRANSDPHNEQPHRRTKRLRHSGWSEKNSHRDHFARHRGGRRPYSQFALQFLRRSSDLNHFGRFHI